MGSPEDSGPEHVLWCCVVMLCCCVVVLLQEMSSEERLLIQDLNKCDFSELHAMHKAKVEARKNMSKEEKLVRPSPSERLSPPLELL